MKKPIVKHGKTISPMKVAFVQRLILDCNGMMLIQFEKITGTDQFSSYRRGADAQVEGCALVHHQRTD